MYIQYSHNSPFFKRYYITLQKEKKKLTTMRFSGRGEINDEEDDIFALKKEQSLFVNFKIIGG